MWHNIAKEIVISQPEITAKPLQNLLLEEGYDIKYDTVKKFLQNKRQTIIFKNKKECDDVNVENFLRAMRDMQKAKEEMDTKQVKATIEITDDKPIAIAFWSDWHEGALGVDYDLLDRDTDLIANTEGLYWIGGGDYKDNYQSHGHVGAQYEQIIQPGMQDIAVKYRMSKVSHNNLALVRGCHDDWDKKQSDKDFISELCDITGAINLWHGGDVFIELGELTYHFKCRHKYKFESALNKENAMRRIMEVQGACDVALSAHLHDPYLMDGRLQGDYRILGRAGSYKVWDEFGQKLAGYKGYPRVPCVILYPDRKEMIPMWLDKTVKILPLIRQK